mmetsp:Transcript_33403/g.62578  ORF Transcript_33403/g.62578 Transcript_33403/m.62578 type:complete len:224 (+) Transcript_33403:79-750(+)
MAMAFEQEWKIPPCIANWKKWKPFEKRPMAEDLYMAEHEAKEEIKIRNDLVRQKKVREEEIREQQLRDLAAQVRQQRAELASGPAKEGENRETHSRRQRIEVLKERWKEIERDQRRELAGKRKKRRREEDRDISERVALGQVMQLASTFDQRLFNQSAGLDSGFSGCRDETVAVYDKPLFADGSQAGIYKFDKGRMAQKEGRSAHRPSPRNTATVEFELDEAE